MTINTVVSNVLLACIISTFPFTAALSTNVPGNTTQHTNLRLTTNISKKTVSGTVSPKYTGSMKVKDNKGKAKSPEFKSQFVIPIIYEKNIGQTDKKIDYLLRQQNYVMYFTENEFISVTRHPEANLGSSKTIENKPSILKMSLVNAHARKPEGTRNVKTRINQYIGADEKKWLTSIPGYSQLHYKNIYKGIDMLWKSKGGLPQYQFNVDSNTPEESIRIKFSSSAHLSIDKNNLKITLPNGVIFHSEPQFFEEMPRGRMKTLKGHYVLINKNEIGFKVINRTLGKKLVIDPTVFVITRSISATPVEDIPLPNIKKGFDIETFGTSIFVAGTAMAPLPLLGRPGNEGQARGGDGDNSFIIKIKMNAPTGANLTDRDTTISPLPYSYITYIGGSDSELNTVISLAGNGGIYFGGTTKSDNFPTPGSTFRDSPSLTGEPFSEKQAFIGKLTGFGEMQLGTMIGKGSNHFINDIKFSENHIYVAGVVDSIQAESDNDATDSEPPPDSDATNAALQKNIRGSTDGFVAKLDANLAGLEYFTFLGGEYASRDSERDSGGVYRGQDFIYGLDVFNKEAYLAGTTASDSFYITENAVQKDFSFPDTSNSCGDEFYLSCYDGFVTVLNDAGSDIEYSTYYGGQRVDIINDISVQEGLVAITGTHSGSLNATTDNNSGGNETSESRAANAKHLFVAALNLITSFTTNNGFVFDKQFNLPDTQRGNGVGRAIHIDALGNIHVTGEVSRGGLAVGSPSDNNLTRTTVLGESDMFYMLIPQGNETGRPNFFTYFGSEGRDIGQGVTTRLDSATGVPCADIVGHQNVGDNLSRPPLLPQQPLAVYSLCLNDNNPDNPGDPFDFR